MGERKMRLRGGGKRGDWRRVYDRNRRAVQCSVEIVCFVCCLPRDRKDCMSSVPVTIVCFDD